MNKIILIQCIFYTVILTAQKPKVLVMEGLKEDFKILLYPDNTFQAFSIDGKLVEKEGVKHLVVDKNTERIKLSVIETGKTDSVSLNIYRKLYELYDFYIATSNNKDDEPNYESLKNLIKKSNNDDYKTKSYLTITVPASKYLYFIVPNNNNKSKKNPTEFLFQIPENAKNMDVFINNNILEEFILTEDSNGVYTLVYSSTEAKDKYTFREESYYENLKYISVLEEKEYSDLLGDEQDNYTEKSYDRPKVEVKQFAKLADALSYLKTKPESCLWITTENNDAYEEIQKYYAEYLKEYPIDDEDSRLQWTFYQAQKSDKSFWNKLKLDANIKNAVIMDGNIVILQSPERIKTIGESIHYNDYTNISYLDSKLTQSKGLILKEKAFGNKNASIQELTKAFASVSDYNTVYLKKEINSSFPAITVAPPKVEDIGAEYETLPADPGEYGDTMATIPEIGMVEEYKPFNFKEKLYQSPIFNPKLVDSQWLKLLNYYTAQKSYNNSFLESALAELSGTGYSQNLFSITKESYSELDFQTYNYILKYYEQAYKAGAFTEQQDYYYEKNKDNNPSKYSLEEILFDNQFLNLKKDPKNASKYEENIERFISINNSQDKIQSYISHLSEIKQTEKLLKAYRNFISKYDTKSIIEDLNTKFEEEGDYSWSDYKNTFSRIANTSAWYIVENRISDKKLLQEAINWSETSLKISKNNPNYLDTLAQLYYLNGNKQKAIDFQTQALQYGVNKENSLTIETLNEMSETLKKMKNNTY